MDRARDLDARLSANGYSVAAAKLADSELRAIKAELTVSPQLPGGRKRAPLPSARTTPSFRLWKEGKTRLYLPKVYGLQKFGAPPPDRVTLHEGANMAEAVSFVGSLRAEQLPAASAWLAAVDDPVRMGGILSLPCGCGKTVLALYLMGAVRKKTLVVVHKNFLLEQWAARLREFLPAARLGLLKARTVDVRDKDVVLASLQSLSMKDYPPAVLADFGLLVLDEVHHTGAEVFSRALDRANVRRTLGLSATVERKDGLTKVFTWYIGNVAYAMQRASGADVVRVVVQRVTSADPSYAEEPCMAGGTLNTARMVNNVTGYAPRTRALVDAACAVLDADPLRRALVLSDRLEHLREMDREFGRRPRAVTRGMYVGGMKPAALAASESARVILATFAFASEGFDVPGLDTLFLASPKTDIEQSVGRILRQKAADRRTVPLVVDFADGFSVFLGQAARRRQFYRRKGYSLALPAPLALDGGAPLHLDCFVTASRATASAPPASLDERAHGGESGEEAAGDEIDDNLPDYSFQQEQDG